MNCLHERSVIQLLTAGHRRAEKFPRISHKQVASVITTTQRYLGNKALQVKNSESPIFDFVLITLMYSRSTWRFLVRAFVLDLSKSTVTDTNSSINGKVARNFRQTSSTDSRC